MKSDYTTNTTGISNVYVSTARNIVMKCESCEYEAKDLNDDGYCEDCVIDIGVDHQLAIHDID